MQLHGQYTGQILQYSMLAAIIFSMQIIQTCSYIFTYLSVLLAVLMFF